MRWWCSADGSRWSWTPRPYIGSWILLGALALLLWRGGAFSSERSRRQKVAGVLGLSLVLIAIEWPLAAMGAGYLASAQMVRQILVVLIATPLLLYSSPDSWGSACVATPRRARIYEFVTYPLFGLLGATVLLFTVNLPVVVDPLVKTQLGSFLVDLVWIAAGVLMWLPVQPPGGRVARLKGPPAIVYLIGVSVAPLPIAFFMTWSELPIFAVYELAPRVFNSLDAKSDQEFAAAIFQVGGGLVIWIQIAVRFINMAGGTKERTRFRGTLVPVSATSATTPEVTSKEHSP
ncbi:MAG TPA: hypothetical protein DEG43_08830 [Acidimicrobiaceae bacterium]|jgi:cytochrome c oxidase assembly factor CtaG|nr:hypothetical protein [Acidimicrobiaceae bacterium]